MTTESCVPAQTIVRRTLRGIIRDSTKVWLVEILHLAQVRNDVIQVMVVLISDSQGSVIGGTYNVDTPSETQMITRWVINSEDHLQVENPTRG